MEIILLENINHLGKTGKIVKVKSGYGRNYLIPYGKAVLASKDNIQALDKEKSLLIQKKYDNIKNAHLRIQEIKNIGPIKIFVKARSSGKLFGSIGIKNVVKFLNQLGINVNKQEIIFPEGVIRYLGNYNIIFYPFKAASCYIGIKILKEE